MDRDEFHIISKAQKERWRQQEHDDHNNDLRGMSEKVGRMARPINPEVREDINGERKGKKMATALELAMLNADYAEMYNTVLNGNIELLNNMTDLDDRIGRLMDNVNEKIETTLNQAVTLPDGRKVFMHEDGQVYSSDNELVDLDLVAGIDWTGRPTYSDYLALLTDRDDVQELRDENNRNSVRAGEIQNDLEDHDNPPSSEQLQSHKTEQKSLSDRTNDLKDQVTQIENKYDETPELQQSELSQSMAAAPKVDGLNF